MNCYEKAIHNFNFSEMLEGHEVYHDGQTDPERCHNNCLNRFPAKTFFINGIIRNLEVRK
jgi:hypothetical protein